MGALEQLVRTLTTRSVPNADLLRDFARSGDEAAFAELQRRHGPLVWAACRTMLSPADAEDAFQATFLTLIRSAGSVKRGAAVGAWLHGVAVKVAFRIRRTRAARRKREIRMARPEAEQPVSDGSWERLRAAVHEEVEKLPMAMRDAFVLCDLQGVSQPEAAKRLGCPLGSLSGRLSKARAKLASRLQSRGIAPTVAVLAAAGSESAIVPTALASKVRAFALSPGVASAVVQTLSKEVTTMKAKWLLAASLLTAGAVMIPMAGGQQANQNNPLPVTDPNRQNWERALQQVTLPESSYRFVPLDKAETMPATVKRLTEQAAQGYTFCGSLDMSLSPGEVEALRGGDSMVQAGERKPHRVLVFKRNEAAGLNKVSGGLNAPFGAAPGTDLTDPLDRTPVQPGKSFNRPAGAMQPGTDLTGSQPLELASPRAGNNSNRPVGAVQPAVGQKAKMPSTLAYRPKNVSVATMASVATRLAKGSDVAAEVESQTGVLILTGDSEALKEILVRLESLDVEIGDIKLKAGSQKQTP
jgi:RNA polymerase sigma factor (sigma-70 family)